jgi:uncharacterized membrane protein YcjF (UPF0283 family)
MIQTLYELTTKKYKKLNKYSYDRLPAACQMAISSVLLALSAAALALSIQSIWALYAQSGWVARRSVATTVADFLLFVVDLVLLVSNVGLLHLEKKTGGRRPWESLAEWKERTWHREFDIALHNIGVDLWMGGFF